MFRHKKANISLSKIRIVRIVGDGHDDLVGRNGCFERMRHRFERRQDRRRRFQKALQRHIPVQTQQLSDILRRIERRSGRRYGFVDHGSVFLRFAVHGKIGFFFLNGQRRLILGRRKFGFFFLNGQRRFVLGRRKFSFFFLNRQRRLILGRRKFGFFFLNG